MLSQAAIAAKSLQKGKKGAIGGIGGLRVYIERIPIFLFLFLRVYTPPFLAAVAANRNGLGWDKRLLEDGAGSLR